MTPDFVKPDYCKQNHMDCYKCEFYRVSGCTLNEDYRKILDDLVDKEGE